MFTCEDTQGRNNHLAFCHQPLVCPCTGLQLFTVAPPSLKRGKRRLSSHKIPSPSSPWLRLLTLEIGLPCLEVDSLAQKDFETRLEVDLYSSWRLLLLRVENEYFEEVPFTGWIQRKEVVRLQ